MANPTVNLLKSGGNQASTTLSGSLSDSGLSFAVNDASEFANQAFIGILGEGTSSEEYVQVSGITGSTVTIAASGRGVLNTTAVGHAVGTTFSAVLTNWQWDKIVEHGQKFRDDDGNYKNDTYVTFTDNAGTGTVNGIKVNASDQVELGTNLDVTSSGIQVASINDTNNNELIEASPASNAVNHIQVTNAATTTNPSIDAVGSDTNIGLELGAKGDEKVRFTSVWDSNVQPHVRARRSTTQTIPNNSATLVTFPTEDFDVGGMHSTSTNTDRLTFIEGGTYAVGYTVVFTDGVGSGQVSTALHSNGSLTNTDGGQSLGLSAQTFGNSQRMSGFTIRQVNDNDYTRLEVLQDTGSGLDITPVYFWAFKLC